MEFVAGVTVAALGGACLYANLPTNLTIGAVVPTSEHLKKAKLIPIRGGPEEKERLDQGEMISGTDLFKDGPILIMAVRRPGCPFCRREAAEIQKLSPLLKQHGIRLAAVVHETFGTNKFKKSFSEGEVYLDTQRTFYGPRERWLPVWMGVLRIGTYLNLYKSLRAKVGGNLKGEGRLLGGVFLVANDDVVYAHLEKEWGDAARIEDIENAVAKLTKKN